MNLTKKISAGLAAGFCLAHAAALAAPPQWWSERLPSTDIAYPDGYPEVVNPESDPANKAAANVGQAKWIAKNLLERIRKINPVLASQIESDLVGSGKPLANWNAPGTQAEHDRNHGALLLGQLKAIARPFYNRLNLVAPAWVLNEIQRNHGDAAVLNTDYWQVSGNSNYTSGGYIPWNPSASQSGNYSPVAIGQLKAAFSLRVETLPLSAYTYGRTGGATEMNLWSATGLYDNEDEDETNDYHNDRDPADNVPYTVNPNLWCKDLLPKMTGLVVAKDDCGTYYNGAGECWRSRYGGVAITKRHVLYCAHSYTHAQGTWSAYNGNTGTTPPTRLRFIDASGNVVDRIQLHQAEAGTGDNNAANDNGAHRADLCVAVLDQDLPDSIHPLQIIPLLTSNQSNALQTFALSQEYQPAANGDFLSYNPFPVGDYPAHNRQMFYRFDQVTGFNYMVWGGDSGSAALALVDGQVVLEGILSGALFDTVADGWTPEARLNKLIEVADGYAVSSGRMAQATGYTVEVAPSSLFP